MGEAGRHQFNEGQSIAAERAWNASLAERDKETCKALERLSATYFWAACGMDRIREDFGESADGGQPTPSPAQVRPGDKRGHGLEAPRARLD